MALKKKIPKPVWVLNQEAGRRCWGRKFRKGCQARGEACRIKPKAKTRGTKGIGLLCST